MESTEQNHVPEQEAAGEQQVPPAAVAPPAPPPEAVAPPPPPAAVIQEPVQAIPQRPPSPPPPQMQQPQPQAQKPAESHFHSQQPAAGAGKLPHSEPDRFKQQAQQHQYSQLEPPYYPSTAHKKTSREGSRSREYSRPSSHTSRLTPNRSMDFSDILGSMSREFRGTSPAVLENISCHPLLYKTYDMPINPKLSARSKKVIRDASELGQFSPGLKTLLEVCLLFFLFSFRTLNI